MHGRFEHLVVLVSSLILVACGNPEVAGPVDSGAGLRDGGSEDASVDAGPDPWMVWEPCGDGGLCSPAYDIYVPEEDYVRGEEIHCDIYMRPEADRCIVGQEKCCQDYGGVTYFCAPRDLSCSHLQAFCDGPEDCKAGLICCSAIYRLGINSVGAQLCVTPEDCLSRTAFAILCHDEDDCLEEKRNECCYTAGAAGFACQNPDNILPVQTCDLENFVPPEAK